MKPRTIAQRRLTAYHEAGHAVAAWWLGHPAKQVTIVPGDGYDGRARHANPFRRMPRDISPEWTDPDSIEGARMMRHIDHAIIIALAGSLAQKRYSPRSPMGGAHSDYREAGDLICRVYDGKVAATYWAYMEARTEALVERQWAPIKRLARALLERETMTGREILAVLNADLSAGSPGVSRRA